MQEIVQHRIQCGDSIDHPYISKVLPTAQTRITLGIAHKITYKTHSAPISVLISRITIHSIRHTKPTQRMKSSQMSMA